MALWTGPHKSELKEAGWHSRGYLPHFDGREVPQFVTLRLFDSVPKAVLEKWQRELDLVNSTTDRILMQRQIARYLDQGFGKSFLRDPQVATMIQTDLLSYDEKTLKLSAWVVMPNHIHLLLTRFEDHTLAGVMQSLKSLSSHKANKILKRSGPFWMADYFDRYIRDGKHFAKTIHYIENNPVKARLCVRPEDWQFSSARYRGR